MKFEHNVLEEILLRFKKKFSLNTSWGYFMGDQNFIFFLPIYSSTKILVNFIITRIFAYKRSHHILEDRIFCFEKKICIFHVMELF